MNVIVSGSALSLPATKSYLEQQLAAGAVAIELGGKLSKDQVKLIANVTTNGTALVFQCANQANVTALTTALKAIGVRQSESNIPGMPGRLNYMAGGKRTEIQVTVQPSGVLA